ADVISAGYRARIFDIQLDLTEDLLFGFSFLLTVYVGALAVIGQELTIGLLPPSSGGVLVDGVPLGPATLSAWRGPIAAVMQDDYLLSGTLADNICFV